MVMARWILAVATKLGWREAAADSRRAGDVAKAEGIELCIRDMEGL